jgi:putative heme-binding domain-containing protein
MKQSTRLGIAALFAAAFTFSLQTASAAAAPAATPTSPTALYAPPGFKVELLTGGDLGEGSWVAMTKDDRGRLILSPQHREANSAGGLLRITLGPDGHVAKREFIAQPLYDAQGLTYINGSIYAVVNKYTAKQPSGLYRIKDKGNDLFEDIQLLKEFPGNGEHGPHIPRLGPDGKLYIMAGNHTRLPEGIASDSPHRNYQEDHLLPRQWDGNGHATGILAPGGYIVRTDLDGKSWDLFCAGFRNPYHFAFNSDGEIFVFDADMEWDWGTPWYRPTRVNHAVSGGEYGWRSGTGKWPAYYPDSLPAIDIGVGCPTGVEFAYGAKFPAKYQRALYILDWTYGRVMAVHLSPDGSSYSGKIENFVCPLGLMQPGGEKRPFNVTDLVIGNDGAMYLTIGGRNTAAGLYRISYTGTESTAPAMEPNKAGAKDRDLRHKLEAFHGHIDAKAVAFAWPHLNSDDRFIRYAARIAIEAQPVAQWRDRALAEKKTDAGLAALLALARVGGKETQPALLEALKRFKFSSLTESQQLDKLRIIGVSSVRQGRPAKAAEESLIAELDAQYPAKTEFLNRELAQVLIYLHAPNAIGKTLKLMADAPTQEEQIHYLFHLRTAQNWTMDQRKQYFTFMGQKMAASQNVEFYEPDYPGTKPGPMPMSKNHNPALEKWFKEAGRAYGDGSSLANFLKNFYAEALMNLTAAEQQELQPLLTSMEATLKGGKPSKSAFPAPQQHAFVQEWKMSDLLNELGKTESGRNLAKGKQAFVDAQCIQCHRFGNEGGGVGPDLTAVSARFSARDLLESIVEPSKVVSEQFQNTTVLLKNGDDVTGRLLNETATELILQPNPLQPARVTVKKTDVAKKSFSAVSPMPEGLVNTLSKEDILDLIAFLQSAGNPGYSAFRRK